MIYTSLVELYRKKSTNCIKNGVCKQKFPRRKHIDGQSLGIALENVNLNINEMSSYTNKNGTQLKRTKSTIVHRNVEKTFTRC